MINYLIDGTILLIIALLMFTLHRLLLAIPALIIGIYLIVRGVTNAIAAIPAEKKDSGTG